MSDKSKFENFNELALVNEATLFMHVGFEEVQIAASRLTQSPVSKRNASTPSAEMSIADKKNLRQVLATINESKQSETGNPFFEELQRNLIVAAVLAAGFFIRYLLVT